MTETTTTDTAHSPAPAPSPPPGRRAVAACREHIRAWADRLPVQVTVRHGSTRTRASAAWALNQLNELAGVVALFAAVKVVSLFMGTGADAGFAELGAALAAYLAIRRVTVVRAVPASPDGQA